MSVSRETGVSRETLYRLAVYKRLLVRWNEKINLISSADVNFIDERHIQDSLQLTPLVPKGTDAILDVGTGAGLPGLILAIATDIPTTLVEVDVRKCVFLREAARLTHAPVTILCSRLETADLGPFPFITARAVSSLTNLLTITVPRLAFGGTLIFPKGEAVDTEIAEAETTWAMKITRFPSQTHANGVILSITEPHRVR